MLTSILIVVAVIIFAYLGFKKIKISREQFKASKKQIELSQEQLEVSQKQIELFQEQLKDSQKQLEFSKKQIKISQKAQYSEQFLKSVDLLASQDLGVLLGGLASLESLSQENKEEYKRVWKHLGDFLRYHQPLQPKAEKPYPEVKAIAKMLRERNTDYEDENFRLNLSEVNLEGANLEGANLVEANLEEANLVDADLKGAFLWGANLWNADLRRANLWNANLKGANLGSAFLWEAKLGNANLRDALLWSADLKGANLGSADLEKANLRDAFLWGANLWNADLRRANLLGALFGGTNEAQDLTNLTPEQLQGTYYDIKYPILKLPDGISEENKPKAISVKEWIEIPKYWGFL